MSIDFDPTEVGGFEKRESSSTTLKGPIFDRKEQEKVLKEYGIDPEEFLKTGEGDNLGDSKKGYK